MGSEGDLWPSIIRFGQVRCKRPDFPSLDIHPNLFCIFQMGTPPLSPETLRRLNIVFASEERATAERLLVERCGNNLPFLEKSDAVELERYRYAAMKLSRGSIDGLKAAIKIANKTGTICPCGLASVMM